MNHGLHNFIFVRHLKAEVKFNDGAKKVFKIAEIECNKEGISAERFFVSRDEWEDFVKKQDRVEASLVEHDGCLYLEYVLTQISLHESESALIKEYL